MKATCVGQCALWISLLCVAVDAQSAEKFPIKAGDGSEILSPIDPATVPVKDGDKQIDVPKGMVYVPAGKFRFGRSEAKELPAFCIGRFEVTNAEYKSFLEETGFRGTPRYWKNDTYPEGKANHPVLFVSLDHAEAYCDWISKTTGQKVIIPSAEQWEKAARGPEGFQYPWGNDRDCHYDNGTLRVRFNYNAVCAAHVLSKEAKTVTRYDDNSDLSGKETTINAIVGRNGQRFGISPEGSVSGWIDHDTNTGFVNTEFYHNLVEQGGHTTAVGHFSNGVSAYGCHDMAGNAYEWTTSLITATNGAENGKQVNDVRGGSWYAVGRNGTCLSTGEGRQRRGAYHSVGFRIAMSMTDP